MAVLKPGLLKTVGSLTRAWPSVACEGTAAAVQYEFRRLAMPASGALDLFWTRSAAHTNTCTATALQLQSHPPSEQPLPFFVAARPNNARNQSCMTHNSPGLAPPSGSTVLAYSLHHNSCSIRMGESKLFATGRHYQTSSSDSSAKHLRDQSVEQCSQTVDELETVCWGCKQHLPRGNLVCSSCHKVQPVNSQLNYFEVMGM